MQDLFVINFFANNFWSASDPRSADVKRYECVQGFRFAFYVS
jgi:hypothetical protein